jgi:hypothetical protein
MKKIIFLTFLLSSISIYSQWTYKSGKSDFDGGYKTSSVYGSGGKFPYNKPLLVVNKFKESSLNIYISNAGYSGCSNNVISLKFNGDEKIYKTDYSSSGSNNDSWFLSSFYELEDFELLEKMMKHSYMSARLKSSCGYSDYKFSLGGSTKAINFVVGKNWIQQKKDEILYLKILEDKMLKENKILDSISALKLKKEREDKRLRDSVINAQKEITRKLIIEENKRKEDELLTECKEYLKKYPGKGYDCYKVSTKSKLRKRMQDSEDVIPIKEGILLLIDENFKNKVFYKVLDYNNFGPLNLYILKKDVILIREMYPTF